MKRLFVGQPGPQTTIYLHKLLRSCVTMHTVEKIARLPAQKQSHCVEKRGTAPLTLGIHTETYVIHVYTSNKKTEKLGERWPRLI